MKKKKFPFFILILIILIVLVGFFAWDIFKYKKEVGNFEKNGQVSITPETQEAEECQTVDLPNYEISKIDSEPLEFKVDLNGDQKEEIIRVYDQKTENGLRNLPIIMKISSGSQDCQKEEFSYIGEKDPAANLYENEIADFQIISNFWGDGRNVIMLLGEQTAYGSGFTIYMHLFTFKDGKYLNIEGPELDELSTYKFNDEEPKG
jgi:preprotein translocase subunit SecF